MKRILLRLLIIFVMILFLPATWFILSGVGKGARMALIALTHYKMPEFPAPDMWIGFVALLMIAALSFFAWFIWVWGGWVQKGLERQIRQKWGLGSTWEIERRERREAAARAARARAAAAAADSPLPYPQSRQEISSRELIDEDPEQSYLQRIGLEED